MARGESRRHGELWWCAAGEGAGRARAREVRAVLAWGRAGRLGRSGTAWRGRSTAVRLAAAARWRRRRLGLGGKVATGSEIFFAVVRLSSPPNAIEKETEKSPEVARDPLTGRSGGSDRTLPPSVRSISEMSKSSGIRTGRVRWSMTGRRQGPVRTT